MKKERLSPPLKSFRVCGPLTLVRPEKDDPRSLVRAGMYGHVDVEPARLNPVRVIGFEAQIEILSFDGRFDTRTVLSALHAPGGTPAPLEALLMLGVQHPRIQYGWNKGQRGTGGDLYASFPLSVSATRDVTEHFWCPKIVCLGEPVMTGVADHPAALGLSYQDSFGRGRNIVAFMHERIWDGEDFCFPRVLFPLSKTAAA